MQESELVVERENIAQASAAMLLQMAVSTVPNMGIKPESTKSMMKTFSDSIKRLLGDK